MGKARAKASKGKKTTTVKDLTVKDAKAVKGGSTAGWELRSNAKA